MSGLEPRTFVIGSDRSTNWATTTAQYQNQNTYTDILLDFKL